MKVAGSKLYFLFFTQSNFKIQYVANQFRVAKIVCIFMLYIYIYIYLFIYLFIAYILRLENQQKYIYCVFSCDLRTGSKNFKEYSASILRRASANRQIYLVFVTPCTRTVETEAIIYFRFHPEFRSCRGKDR